MGVPDVGNGSASFGYSVSSGGSNEFTQTWTDATTYTSSDNADTANFNTTDSNALNYNLDTFEIWLNPEVILQSVGTKPVSWNVYSQLTTIDGEPVHHADILPVPAMSMMLQPPGVKTALNPTGAAKVSGVLYTALMPRAIGQENQVNVYQPGLGAICANQTLYQEQVAADQANPNNPAQICTQENQCGCQPSDFASIMAEDPMLNYNSKTYTDYPESGTVPPLEADALPTTSGPRSGETVCGYDQPAGYRIPSGSNCRYVIVPQEGTNVPIIQPLDGEQPLSYTQSDSTLSTFTTQSGNSYNVGVSREAGLLLIRP